MRGVIAGTSSHSAEFLVDLHKAFELVDRGLLLKAAMDAGYPCDVLAWGLSMYGWRTRLVFRKCVTAEMFPMRGIAAGSAFATTELWLLLAGSLGRLTRRFPLVVFCLHVDDLSATDKNEDPSELANSLAEVHAAAREELQHQCLTQIADPKTMVAASSDSLAETVAERIGGTAEAGTSARKLGADYSLASWAPVPARLPQSAASGFLGKRRRCARSSCCPTGFSILREEAALQARPFRYPRGPAGEGSSQAPAA